MKSNDLAVAIGKRISQIRHKLGMSQEELAQISGVSKNFIGQIERGERPSPSISKIADISSALNITLSDLFRGIDLRMIACTNEEEEKTALSLFEGIIEEVMYPPKFPRYEVSTLLEFLIYLPLMNPRKLLDSLMRISGDMLGKEQYVLDQINYCVSSIPASAAKYFADSQAKKLNRECYRHRDDELVDYTSHKHDEYAKTIERAIRFLRLYDAMGTLNI